MNIFANELIYKDKDTYSEHEAAGALGISMSRLHMLLDEHVFNDGGSRPRDIELTSSDLLLLQFWNRATASEKVIAMPKRTR